MRQPAAWRLLLASFNSQLLGLTARDADLFRTAGLADRYRDGEDTMLVAGVDLVSINGFGEGDAAFKGASPNFLNQPVDLLIRLDRGRELALDGQTVLLHGQLNVFRF